MHGMPFCASVLEVGGEGVAFRLGAQGKLWCLQLLLISNLLCCSVGLTALSGASVSTMQ